MARPVEGSYPDGFKGYISKVKDEDAIAALRNQQEAVDRFFDQLTEDDSKYSYQAGKWTLKEMLQHLSDAERVFNYRALAIARGEQASLPGFDEDSYAANSYANRRPWADLVDEFKAIRKSTVMLYSSFPGNIFDLSGMANNKPITVNAIAFATVGHFAHHMEIIETRYFPGLNKLLAP